MMHLLDHAAGRRRINESGPAADAVEPEADQRLALFVLPPDRTADLLDRDGLGRRHDDVPPILRASASPRAQSADASASPPSRRRACRADTLMLRRAATERGES